MPAPGSASRRPRRHRPEGQAREAAAGGYRAHRRVARCLGEAVLAPWSDLPPEVRNAHVEQAPLVGDRQEAADLRPDMLALILKHRGDLS
jgi:hypothetical protein